MSPKAKENHGFLHTQGIHGQTGSRKPRDLIALHRCGSPADVLRRPRQPLFRQSYGPSAARPFLSGGYLPDAGGYSCEAAPLSTFHFLHPSTSVRALSSRFEKLSSPAAELPACAPCPPKVPSPVFGSAGRLEGAFRGRVTPPPEGPGTPCRGPRSAMPCGRRTPFRRGRCAAAPAPVRCRGPGYPPGPRPPPPHPPAPAGGTAGRRWRRGCCAGHPPGR